MKRLNRMTGTRATWCQMRVTPQETPQETPENTTSTDRCRGNVNTDGRELCITPLEATGLFLGNSTSNDNPGENEADLGDLTVWGSWILECRMNTSTTNPCLAHGKVEGREQVLTPMRKAHW